MGADGIDYKLDKALSREGKLSPKDMMNKMLAESYGYKLRVDSFGEVEYVSLMYTIWEFKWGEDQIWGSGCNCSEEGLSDIKEYGSLKEALER